MRHEPQERVYGPYPHRKRWRIVVIRAEIESDGVGDAEAYLVSVDANDVALLLAEVLKHQRRVHKLTTVQVAKKLGAASANAYQAYEQGKREPSVAKFRELLAAVAPELALSVGPRKVAR